MDTASSKPRRRSMRVATIFTGVAACTAGLAQVATAQDAAHADAVPTTNNTGHGIRPAYVYTGSIKSVDACADQGVDKTWLHVSTTHYFSSYAFVTSLCFGNRGTMLSPPFTGIRAECGGNNHGYLMGTNSKGNSWYLSFGPGTTYRTYKQAHLNNVTIYSWTGKDTCPAGPDFGYYL